MICRQRAELKSQLQIVDGFVPKPRVFAQLAPEVANRAFVVGVALKKDALLFGRSLVRGGKQSPQRTRRFQGRAEGGGGPLERHHRRICRVAGGPRDGVRICSAQEIRAQPGTRASEQPGERGGVLGTHQAVEHFMGEAAALRQATPTSVMP